MATGVRADSGPAEWAPQRTWAVGDETRLLDRTDRVVDIAPCDGIDTLPVGAAAHAEEAAAITAVETCLEASTAVSRSFSCRVSWTRHANGAPVQEVRDVMFSGTTGGGTARLAAGHAECPSELVHWAGEYPANRTSGGDVRPALLAGAGVGGPATAGILGSTGWAIPDVLADRLRVDTLRGSWWVDDYSDLQMIVRYSFEGMTTGPQRSRDLAGLAWFTGGNLRCDGALQLRRDSRFPESHCVWQATVDGCVSVGDRLIRVTERTRRDSRVFTEGVPSGDLGEDDAGRKEAEARTVTVFGWNGERAVRIAGGMLMAPDVVLTVAHATVGLPEKVECVWPGGRAKVIAVAFPSPRSDVALLRLSEVPAAKLRRITAYSPPDGAPMSPLRCLIFSSDDAGVPKTIEATLVRSSLQAHSFALTCPVREGDSGSPVFAVGRGLLGVVAEGGEEAEDHARGELLADGLATGTVATPRWIVLDDWRTAIPQRLVDSLAAAGRPEGQETLSDEATTKQWLDLSVRIPGAYAAAAAWMYRLGCRLAPVDRSRAESAFRMQDDFDSAGAWSREQFASWDAWKASRSSTEGDLGGEFQHALWRVQNAPGSLMARMQLARAAHAAAGTGNRFWIDLVPGLLREDLPLHVRRELAEWIADSRRVDLMRAWLSAAEGIAEARTLSCWMRALRAHAEGLRALARSALTDATGDPSVADLSAPFAARLAGEMGDIQEAIRLSAGVDVRLAPAWWFDLGASWQLIEGKPDEAWTLALLGLQRFPWDRKLLGVAGRITPPGKHGPDKRILLIDAYVASTGRSR